MRDPEAKWTVRAGPSGTRFTNIRSFEVIDSTNRYLVDDAKAALAAGGSLAFGTVAVAAHQSAGRGRHGRVWDSKPGASLLFSVLNRPVLVPGLQGMAMGLAVIEACAALGVTASLKWPNDVLIEGRKLAGILGEVVGDGERIAGVVVGCGINLNWKDLLPAALDQRATSLDEHAGSVAEDIDRFAFLDAVLRAFDRLVDLEQLVPLIRQHCSTIGQRVQVQRPAGDLVGLALDIDATGTLVIEDVDHVRHTVSAGEVTHLRPARADW